MIERAMTNETLGKVGTVLELIGTGLIIYAIYLLFGTAIAVLLTGIMLAINGYSAKTESDKKAKAKKGCDHA